MHNGNNNNGDLKNAVIETNKKYNSDVGCMYL